MNDDISIGAQCRVVAEWLVANAFELTHAALNAGERSLADTLMRLHVWHGDRELHVETLERIGAAYLPEGATLERVIRSRPDLQEAFARAFAGRDECQWVN